MFSISLIGVTNRGRNHKVRYIAAGGFSLLDVFQINIYISSRDYWRGKVFGGTSSNIRAGSLCCNSGQSQFFLVRKQEMLNLTDGLSVRLKKDFVV